MIEEIMTVEQLNKLEELLKQDPVYCQDLADKEELLKRLLELLPNDQEHKLNLLIQDFDAIHYSMAQRKAEIAFKMASK